MIQPMGIMPKAAPYPAVANAIFAGMPKATMVTARADARPSSAAIWAFR